MTHHRSSPATEVLDFLNSIEGAGYGGMASFEIARAYVRDMVGAAATPPAPDAHIDWDILAEERLGQRPRSEHGRHIPQTSPAPGYDSGSYSAQAATPQQPFAWRWRPKDDPYRVHEWTLSEHNPAEFHRWDIEWEPLYVGAAQPSWQSQLEEAGKAAIAIRNELDRTRAERDSWEAQFHSAAAAASEYSEFWEKHQRDFDQFGNYIPHSQIDGDLRAAKRRIAELEALALPSPNCGGGK